MKKGRHKQKDTARFQVILDTVPAKWAQGLDGGLSLALRRLLREEYERLNTHEKSVVPKEGTGSQMAVGISPSKKRKS